MRTKLEVFEEIENRITNEDLKFTSKDDKRPWGGFFVIDESQAQNFSNLYFEGMSVDTLRISGKLSPKILIVGPGKRLSWQYHHRRAEIWRVIEGNVGIIRSENDQEGKLEEFKPGDFITLQKRERHRLIGLQDWGIVAEIWQHTDPDNPSDEDDIVRVQDDFGR
jgi:mannose-6-phosphate isomerase